MAIKIVIGNYKGGVGKTTSAFYIANYISELKDKKVLLVDLDPQCSLSEICCTSNNSINALSNLSNNECLNYIIDYYYRIKNIDRSLVLDYNKIIKKCDKLNKKVYFLPSNIFYTYFDEYLGLDNLCLLLEKDSDMNILLLNNIIEDIEKNYDYIIFDCPPSNNILSKSAFLLSDYYIIPYISDDLSGVGAKHYIGTINNIYNTYCVNHKYHAVYRKIFNQNTVLLGLFECMRVRNENPRGNIHNMINANFFGTVIKNLIDIQECLSCGKVSKEQGKYKELTKEILEEIDNVKHPNK